VGPVESLASVEAIRLTSSLSCLRRAAFLSAATSDSLSSSPSLAAASASAAIRSESSASMITSTKVPSSSDVTGSIRSLGADTTAA
jgi:hypothetical protein